MFFSDIEEKRSARRAEFNCGTDVHLIVEQVGDVAIRRIRFCTSFPLDTDTEPIRSRLIPTVSLT